MVKSKLSSSRTLARLFGMANAVTNNKAIIIIVFLGFLSGVSELAIITVSVYLTSTNKQSIVSSLLSQISPNGDILLPVLTIIVFFSGLRVLVFKKVISFVHHIGGLLANRLISTRLTHSYFFDKGVIDNNEFTTTIVNHLQACVSLLQNASLAVSALISTLAVLLLIVFQGTYSVIFAFLSIGFFYILVSKISSYSLKTISNKIAESQRFVHTYVTDSLNLDKESFISSRSSFFINNVTTQFSRLMSSLATASLISGFPRLSIEAFLFIALASIVLGGDSNASFNQDADLILLLISAIRLIPYAQSIYSALTSLRMFSTSISILYDFLSSSSIKLEPVRLRSYENGPEKTVHINYKQVVISSHPSLILSLHVPKLFSTAGASQFSDTISIDINEGDFISIVGSSGVGKSTVFESVVGLTTKVDCSFSIPNSSIYAGFHSCTQLRKSHLKIEYLSQHSSFFSGTIKDNIFMGAESLDMSLLSFLMGEFNLIDSSRDFDSFLSTSIGESTEFSLSGGELKRLSLIRVLVRRPDILFCDEITSGVDIQLENKMAKAIKYCCSACLMITHSLNIMDTYSTKIISLER